MARNRNMYYIQRAQSCNFNQGAINSGQSETMPFGSVEQFQDIGRLSFIDPSPRSLLSRLSGNLPELLARAAPIRSGSPGRVYYANAFFEHRIV
jgi:hypothetical protein